MPLGPGANDNASGTALMIELAHTHRVDGLCVIAFGAEEIGLFGSRAFVDEHEDEVAQARFMLNFDMVSKITSPMFVAGDEELAALASDLASTLDEAIPVGSFPVFASSDHVSFENAGVPAITVHSGNDEFIHTGSDDLENVSAEDLALFLEISTALLRALLDGTSATP